MIHAQIGRKSRILEIPRPCPYTGINWLLDSAHAPTQVFVVFAVQRR